jgi:hypothetical protein
MSQYPTVKAKEFIKVIEKLGFYFDRQKGSHRYRVRYLNAPFFITFSLTCRFYKYDRVFSRSKIFLFFSLLLS